MTDNIPNHVIDLRGVPDSSFFPVLDALRHLADGTSGDITLTVTADQFTVFLIRANDGEDEPAPADEKVKVAVVEETTETRIRRTKEENAAGMSIEQAKEYRASGSDLSPADWMFENYGDGDAAEDTSDDDNQLDDDQLGDGDGEADSAVEPASDDAEVEGDELEFDDQEEVFDHDMVLSLAKTVMGSGDDDAKSELKKFMTRIGQKKVSLIPEENLQEAGQLFKRLAGE